ncbi:MAG: hypothetical protein AAFP03_05290 [Cyanobacteria bacterium J06598_3]
MTVSELIDTLNKNNIRLWVDAGKLRIQAPKGALTPHLKADIAAYKSELVNHLRLASVSLGHSQISGQISGQTHEQTDCGLSLSTIGQLIGGGQTALPVIDPQVMAAQLSVTFRPLPHASHPKSTGIAKPTVADTVLTLRAELADQLRSQGVNITPWEDATREFQYPLPLLGSRLGSRLRENNIFNKLFPLAKWTTVRVVRSEINAVIDVERPVSPIKSWIAERFYQLSKRFSKGPVSAADVTRRIGWAEDHAIGRLEDPTATQVILLTELDERFVDPQLPYINKIGIGVNTLISQFSEIVIGASATQLSILNMNLSDSLFSRSQMSWFVQRSLIPKIYVPIAPLPLSRFEIGHYDSKNSPYAQKLVELSQALAKTDLFPSGFKLAEVVARQSHRDIVGAIVNGRTGVSYGFVAYAEPPVYVGPAEISKPDWQALAPVDGHCASEIRQTAEGRQYLKTVVSGQTVYKQIPDIWLVCSRSGANKTNLDISKDIIRVGMTGKLELQVTAGIDMTHSGVDIKPSYDTYVMIAIALSAALYTPELVTAGAPIIHFHGYPAKAWFGSQENVVGTANPAVPCGTYESGVFNFLSLHQLASSEQRPLNLVGLVEPDHGINLLAKDLAYLLERISQGIEQAKIELGGRYLPSLQPSQPPDNSIAALQAAETPDATKTSAPTVDKKAVAGGVAS